MGRCTAHNINHCEFKRDSRIDVMEQVFENQYKEILGVEVKISVKSINYESGIKRASSCCPEFRCPVTIVDFVAPVFIFSEKEPEFVIEKFTANFDDERWKFLSDQIDDLTGGSYYQPHPYSKEGKMLIQEGLIKDYTEKDFIELKRKFLQRQKWRKQVFYENKVKTNFGWVVFHKMQEQTISFIDGKLEQILADLIKYPVIEIDTENDTYFEL